MIFVNVAIEKTVLVVILMLLINRFAPKVELDKKPKHKEYSWIIVYLVGVLYYVLIGLPIIKTYETSRHAMMITVLLGNLMILPALMLIKEKKLDAKDIGLSGKNLKHSMISGLVIGLAYIIYAYLFERKTLTITVDVLLCFYKFVYVVTSSVVNEFIFRGFIQKQLTNGYGVWKGIFYTAILDILACVILWMFDSSIQTSVFALGVVSHFLGGILYGYMAYKYENIYGGMVASIITNLI